MDRYMRKKMFILAVMAFVGYVSIYHLNFPGKDVLKSAYQKTFQEAPRPDEQGPSQTMSQPSDSNSLQFFTLAYNNKTKDKVYELMKGSDAE